jgi:glutamyl/glutaminyl-tRNA synthetase
MKAMDSLADARQKSYRGRLAPSPTGLLHTGHARTFFTAFLRARDAHGTLILRNEDLDMQRSRPEFVTAMIEDMHWLGIRWQEGADVGGPYSPYTQSERGSHYLAAWRTLLDRGWIYPCRCTRKDLARVASAPHEGAADDDEGPMYPGTCRPEAPASIQKYNAPAGVNWRLRVPDGQVIEFQDQHFGHQSFTVGRDFGDFLIWRRDDVPSYQLACVVDDAAMRITEVVRGADLLKSTARQLLLYEALGLAQPLWYHCPLVTDEHGQRLAKHYDSLSIRALRAQGKSPQDLLRA